MEAQGFASSTITLLAALGAGIGLVVNPLLGGLSDRVGRSWLLCIVYLTGALALVMMAYSHTSLDFTVVAVLTALSGAERAISSALVSDLLPVHARSRGLALFDSVKWLGGVVGLAGTGYVIQLLGLSQALLVSALLPAAAITLLLVLRLQRRTAVQRPAAHLERASGVAP
jgi:MFS family permease